MDKLGAALIASGEGFIHKTGPHLDWEQSAEVR